MRTLALLSLAAALAAPAAALASEKLAQSSGCTACHAADKKLVGPSFKDIAAKYRGSKDAASQLAKKVKAGGKGVWGEIPMPPNAHVKDADIQAIVRWILGLK